MLRGFVIATAGVLCCVGGALLAHHLRLPGWQLLIFGLLVLIGTVFERWRYRAPNGTAGGNWQSTDERFVDPSSGDPVRVLYDPRTGERRYAPDPAHPADRPHDERTW